jgi:hypothetical protein
MSSVAVFTPSPVSAGELSVIVSPNSCPDALKRKNDSSTLGADAVLLSVKVKLGNPIGPLGVTWTWDGSMGVAPFCPVAVTKPEKIAPPKLHPVAPRLI